jgi:hypothetical protein
LTEWFPILGGAPYVGLKMTAIEPYRARIERNHGQTLERLSERGGLDWMEFWCAMNDRPLYPTPKVTAEAARLFVLKAVIFETGKQK